MALNIKKAIKSRGFEVKQIAERMGITAVGLSQHINGNPSVAVLQRIANATGCDIAELFDPVAEPGCRCGETTVACPHCGKSITITTSVN